MASRRTNNMQFHKTKNSNLIKRHHHPHTYRTLSTPLTKNIGGTYNSSNNHKKATNDCFTMIFIDCDDTLIPSKIHRYLFKNLGIDIFNLYQRTMLKQFQYDIIYAIEAIKEIFITEYNEEIKIGIVSNASSKWLNATINNKSENGHFKLLSDYFNDNGIEIKSAIDETFNFLLTKFGDHNKQKVNQMIAMSLNSDDPHKSKWMLKYTTYSSIINKFRRKLKKKCRKIVNIGDGETELEAIKYYAQTFGVDYIALKFIKNATFNQLSYQWKYIKNNFWSIISDMDVDNIYTNFQSVPTHKSVVIEVGKNRKKQFKHKRNLSNVSDASCATTESHKALNTFYFDYVLKNDNNSYFTGTHQLTAIATYFEKWMRVFVQSHKSKQQSDAALQWICAKIHSKMRGNDPYTQHMISFKKMIKEALCRNEEFDRAFDKYYNDLRKSLNCGNKRRKSIDESKCDDECKMQNETEKKHKKKDSFKQSKLYRKRSSLHKKLNGTQHIKNGSLSLMNLASGKNYRRNSATSQGTMTTNSLDTTPTTKRSDKSRYNGCYYTDDSDDLYFSQNVHYDIDADEENSSATNTNVV